MTQPTYIFTTVLIRNGCPLFLSAHLHRLQQNASDAGYVWDAAAVDKAIKRFLIDTNQSSIQAMKINIEKTGTVFCTGKPLPSRTNLTASIINYEPHRHYSSTIKHTDRTHWRTLASQQQTDEVLMVDQNGVGLEFSNGNFFYLRDRVLYTASPDGRFLQGITRCAVLVLAKQVGLSLKIRNQPFVKTDSFYFTSSLRGMIPITLTGQEMTNPLDLFCKKLWKIMPQLDFQQQVNQYFISQN